MNWTKTSQRSLVSTLAANEGGLPIAMVTSRWVLPDKWRVATGAAMALFQDGDDTQHRIAAVAS